MKFFDAPRLLLVVSLVVACCIVFKGFACACSARRAQNKTMEESCHYRSGHLHQPKVVARAPARCQWWHIFPFPHKPMLPSGAPLLSVAGGALAYCDSNALLPHFPSRLRTHYTLLPYFLTKFRVYCTILTNNLFVKKALRIF